MRIVCFQNTGEKQYQKFFRILLSTTAKYLYSFFSSLSFLRSSFFTCWRTENGESFPEKQNEKYRKKKIKSRVCGGTDAGVDYEIPNSLKTAISIYPAILDFVMRKLLTVHLPRNLINCVGILR